MVVRDLPTKCGPYLVMNRVPQIYETYITDYNDPERQRQDAVTESIALLQIVSGKTSDNKDDIPAIVWFNRATRLSVRLGSLGLRDEALQLCTLAHHVVRKLATQNSTFFRPGLANSFSNMSVFLGDMGRRKDALKSIEEAVTIYTSLVKGNPTTFNPVLAAALNNMSNRLSDMGRK